MSVQMNDVLTQIDKNGLYGFNASEGTVQVLDGKAKVLEESRKITLTKDKGLALNSGPVTKAQNLDRKAAEADPLYVWSKVRSREQANENATLARSITSNGSWYGPGWYWDPFCLRMHSCPGTAS